MIKRSNTTSFSEPLKKSLQLILLVGLALIAGLSATTHAAATHNVPAGGNLQAAIDAALPGDSIVLQAGAVYVGSFTLPNKGGSEAYITIKSSRASELAEGVRVTPAQSSLMPKILSPGRGESAVQTAPGAHHYRFIGIEFGRTSPEAVVYDLVKFGDGSIAQNSASQVPHHLELDRCYVHGDAGNLKRGVALNSAHTNILNSYISDFHVRGQEAQAICGWNGPGPFRIVNNYIEGAGENLMFGGATASVPGLVPSDIEIRRNHFTKPVEWRGVWTVKNILELKNARRVVIEGNLFEHCWSDAQVGYAILFTPRPNDSGAWAVVEDVAFVNNVVRNVAAGVNIMGKDYLHTAPDEQRLHRVRVANNLFENVDGERWGGDGVFMKVISGTNQVTIEHNTVFQTGNISKSGGAANTSFVFRYNIVRHNEYGIHGDDAGIGLRALAVYFPGAEFKGNLIAREMNAPWNVETNYPAGNHYPATYASVGFVDAAAGNYRLSNASPYKGAGANGSDPGCNFDALHAAMYGAPVPAPQNKAQESVVKARRDAQSLSNQLAASSVAQSSAASSASATANPSDAMASIVGDIQKALADFGAERALHSPSAANRIEAALMNALTHAVSASSHASQGNISEAKKSLQKAIDNLELVDVLIVYGDVRNPVDYAQYFVRQHYVDFLGREPDESGRAFWAERITSCGANASCAKDAMIDVSAAYYLSIEFKETGYLVHRLYRASFGRTVLFNELIPESQEIARGVIVGAAGWQDRLASNRKAYFQNWTQRADFKARYDALANAQFVDALFATMGVTPSASERASHVASLDSGSTRADVLSSIVDNDDFARLESNKAFVLMQYFGYLRRDPDASGYAYWLAKLDQFGGDYKRAEMVKAFLDSSEYRARFGQ